MSDKPFTVIDAEQRGDAWKKVRAGRLTASRAKDMLAAGKGTSRQNLLVELVVERLTGEPEEKDLSNIPAVQWGIECEPLAFNAYEALTGEMPSKVGFLAHNELPIGCSPDGIIGDFVGGLELKCPQKPAHYSYLRGDRVVPSIYLPQVLHSLWVTGAAYWDFLSFHPAFPPEMQTFYVRVDRSHVATELQDYIGKATTFLDEVDREVAASKGWRILEEKTA